jgi:hypothetical protein
MDRKSPLPPPNEGTPDDATTRRANPTEKEGDDRIEPNPPHTTTGPITSPKFGSAGSGGAEFEPGPKRP